MPESFITDAYGVLHNLTRGAFDAFAINHEGEFDPDFGRVYEMDFKSGFQEIMKKYGVEVASFSALGWADTFRSAMGTFFSSGMADVAAGIAGETVAGPAGAAGATALLEAVKYGYEYFSRRHEGSEVGSYRRGQWVSIDNGNTLNTVHMHNVLDNAWDAQRRRLGGAAMALSSDQISPEVNIGTLKDVHMVKNISIGFFEDSGAEKGTLRCFNMETGRSQDFRANDVSALPQSQAAALDANEPLSEIRLLKFMKKDPIQFNSRVPTDPGTEVVKNGESFQVVRSEGSQLLVEDQWGQRHEGPMDSFEPGARHHNLSWNYTSGGVQSNSFVTIGSQTNEPVIFSGQFVWVTPSEYARNLRETKRELACIQNLDGDSVNFFTAIDGRYRTQLVSEPIAPVSAELNEYFSSSRLFTNFRDAVVRGMDTTTFAPGKERALVCLGVTAEGQPYVDFRYEERGELAETRGGPERDHAPVGDQEMRAVFDAAEIAGKTAGGNAETFVGALQVEPRILPQESGNTSLFVFGGVLVVAYFALTST